MKSLLLFSLIQLSIVVATVAQEYHPADQGSSVTFKVKNFGFNVDGTFTGLQGKVLFDPKAPANASFDVSVDATSVNTDNGQRDNHLKKEDYFDVQNYPRIRFVSTSITPSGKEGKYTITGKLTIKTTTKDISFPFTASPMGNDYIFSGEFTINRKDFGVGGSSTISNSLTVSLAVLAKK
ncbi:MAG TPA: YceI family protein [Puia sp.]|jgi:polyisoprenoid-binding protein YceI|nr:YceI family protein [Puia sp.]